MTKTLTFALMHFAIAFTVAWLMTGSLVVGGAVALVEPAVNTVAFFFHDRLWKRLDGARLARQSEPAPAPWWRLEV
ncbi:MAG: DUF2061 domain-containing protein [Porticoccaceae bacterium]|nr:DUF2061 domain-containing protein [Porticoccaceae bacterium]HLS98209.1 DUF2061 domain-containing protein [Porticoccaceae bacterium]